MPGVPWIKLWVSIFDDEKIKIIQALPGGSDVILCWRRLLCMAGKRGEGGVGTVQLREKDLSTKNLYILARKLREITKELNVNLIINDRVDIAQAVDADGVHMGWQSLNIDIVRKMIGQNK